MKEKDTNKTYSYGCYMLYLNISNWSDIISMVNDDDVYDQDDLGIESEPHITLLYGIHDEEVTDNDIILFTKNLIKDKVKLNVKIKGINFFENEKFDVLKLNLESEDLVEINEKLKGFKYTSSFPNYEPHITISYLKKGTASKYLNENYVVDVVIEKPSYVYSKPDRNKLVFIQ